jgi:putative ABC transport system permease protein
VRLAMRDLAGYQARSGAALAAASLAVGIAATIAITAAAGQAADHTLAGGNLPPDQMIVWVNGNPNGGSGPGVAEANGGGASGPSPAALALARSTANSIAQSLHAQHVLELDTAVNPNSNAPADAPPDASRAILVHPVTERGRPGFSLVTVPFVATPAVLNFYRLHTSAIQSNADIVTARTDLSGTRLSPGTQLGPGKRQTTIHPVTIQVTKLLPDYTSAPNTLITEEAMRAYGLTAQPVGWLMQTSHPLTTAQVTDARNRAAAAGITIETRTAGDHSLQNLRTYSTITGVL